ncbi:hypothetical protein HDU67_005643 [Dinochytrium kinnereticum]|nr:hypothetical protein HDU67_005643 [Dinochytrium kinnereticum]
MVHFSRPLMTGSVPRPLGQAKQQAINPDTRNGETQPKGYLVVKTLPVTKKAAQIFKAGLADKNAASTTTQAAQETTKELGVKIPKKAAQVKVSPLTSKKSASTQAQAAQATTKELGVKIPMKAAQVKVSPLTSKKSASTQAQAAQATTNGQGVKIPTKVVQVSKAPPAKEKLAFIPTQAAQVSKAASIGKMPSPTPAQAAQATTKEWAAKTSKIAAGPSTSTEVGKASSSAVEKVGYKIWRNLSDSTLTLSDDELSSSAFIVRNDGRMDEETESIGSVDWSRIGWECLEDEKPPSSFELISLEGKTDDFLTLTAPAEAKGDQESAHDCALAKGFNLVEDASGVKVSEERSTEDNVIPLDAAFLLTNDCDKHNVTTFKIEQPTLNGAAEVVGERGLLDVNVIVEGEVDEKGVAEEVAPEGGDAGCNGLNEEAEVAKLLANLGVEGVGLVGDVEGHGVETGVQSGVGEETRVVGVDAKVDDMDCEVKVAEVKTEKVAEKITKSGTSVAERRIQYFKNRVFYFENMVEELMQENVRLMLRIVDLEAENSRLRGLKADELPVCLRDDRTLEEGTDAQMMVAVEASGKKALDKDVGGVEIEKGVLEDVKIEEKNHQGSAVKNGRVVLEQRVLDAVMPREETVQNATLLSVSMTMELGSDDKSVPTSPRVSESSLFDDEAEPDVEAVALSSPTLTTEKVVALIDEIDLEMEAAALPPIFSCAVSAERCATPAFEARDNSLPASPAPAPPIMATSPPPHFYDELSSDDESVPNSPRVSEYSLSDDGAELDVEAVDLSSPALTSEKVIALIDEIDMEMEAAALPPIFSCAVAAERCATPTFDARDNSLPASPAPASPIMATSPPPHFYDELSSDDESVPTSPRVSEYSLSDDEAELDVEAVDLSSPALTSEKVIALIDEIDLEMEAAALPPIFSCAVAAERCATPNFDARDGSLRASPASVSPIMATSPPPHFYDELSSDDESVPTSPRILGSSLFNDEADNAAPLPPIYLQAVTPESRSPPPPYISPPLTANARPTVHFDELNLKSAFYRRSAPHTPASIGLPRPYLRKFGVDLCEPSPSSSTPRRAASTELPKLPLSFRDSVLKNSMSGLPFHGPENMEDCERVLKSLKAHSSMKFFSGSHVVLMRCGRKIKNPLDLKCVERKMREGGYSGVPEFVEEVLLIFANCRRAVPASDVLYKKAQEGHREFQRLIRK